MINIILFQPEIPPNTGNIIRLCANFGCRLHLIKPLGFMLDDRRLRRAGLDYREWAEVRQYENFSEFEQTRPSGRLIPFTTKAKQLLHTFTFKSGDTLMFGPETRGLPDDVLASIPSSEWLRVPMQAGSRSLNLANTVAIACYESSRQLGLFDTTLS